MRYVVGICWFITAVCAALAAVIVLSFGLPITSRVTTSVALLAICVTGIPFVFTKAIEGLWKT